MVHMISQMAALLSSQMQMRAPSGCLSAQCILERFGQTSLDGDRTRFISVKTVSGIVHVILLQYNLTV